jgi:long-subunit acyl-CoA synthetase (AMP-forming)
MHPDGTVAIIDRSKDLIISGGENASSLAIEQGKMSSALLSTQTRTQVCIRARDPPGCSRSVRCRPAASKMG